LLPGIMAICMVGTGIWAVAMPLIAEFQFTREIEDRLLAPMEISWLAIEKVVAGTFQALAAGLIVIPAAWLLLRPGAALHVPLARGRRRPGIFQRRAARHRPSPLPRQVRHLSLTFNFVASSGVSSVQPLVLTLFVYERGDSRALKRWRRGFRGPRG